jgi:O-antigen/teichoic acid export membrane protein
MNLARRSVTSVAWNSIASVTKVVVQLARYVILCRWLPVETFGVYAGANAIIGLTVLVATFGMGGAFLHRAPETEDEQQAAAVHLTLKLIFTLAWAGLMATGTLLFATGDTRTALLLLTVTTMGIQLAQTPQLILIRRVIHRRLALLQLVNVLLTTVVAVGLAWQGAMLWALLATDVVTLVLTVVMLYVWRPVWRPRLAWAPDIVRYFLRFGGQNFLGVTLLHALDKVDDLWTRFYLGTTAMGYYSRAYQLATYPRSVLAVPVNAVAGGTYAELKGQRRRLSQAFFRVNALLVRSGFFLAGLIALIIPEFIYLFLGAKWLPMLTAFRLMLVFTLFDPIKSTVAGLLVAVGQPSQVVKARSVQLLVLIGGLLLLGPRMGIAGVALAVDGMLVVGIVILFWQVRAYVDFSSKRLFLVPGGALIAGLTFSLLVAEIPWISSSDWRSLLAKGFVYALVYAVVLIGFEGKSLYSMLELLPVVGKITESVQVRMRHRRAG